MLGMQTIGPWLRARVSETYASLRRAVPARLGVLFAALSGRISQALRALDARNDRTRVGEGDRHD